MRRFWTMGGVGLCLGLTGCAVTERRVVLGPGVGAPGAKPVLVAHPHPQVPCGCGQVRWPVPPTMPVVPSVPPTAMTLARFFPLFHERDGVPADPLETVRPDPLGVRTADRGAIVLNDGQIVPSSAEERESNLPLIVNIGARSGAETPAPVTTVEVVEPSPAAREGGAGVMPVAADGPPGGAEASSPSRPPGPALPEPGAAIPLEHVDDPSLAGRPRLAADGTLIPRPRAGGDPAYGPDPTFPASYAADGSAPTSVPKNREIWPTRRPWRPTLFSRMFQLFRKE